MRKQAGTPWGDTGTAADAIRFVLEVQMQHFLCQAQPRGASPSRVRRAEQRAQAWRDAALERLHEVGVLPLPDAAEGADARVALDVFLMSRQAMWAKSAGHPAAGRNIESGIPPLTDRQAVYLAHIAFAMGQAEHHLMAEDKSTREGRRGAAAGLQERRATLADEQQVRNAQILADARRLGYPDEKGVAGILARSWELSARQIHNILKKAAAQKSGSVRG